MLEYRVREDVEEATQWVVWEGQACGQAVVCLRGTPSARQVCPHWRSWCRSWRRSGGHRSTLWTLRTVVTAPRSYMNNKFGVTKTWKLGRVLPGQRRGAQEWYHQLADDLLCPRSRPSTQMHPLRTWPPRALRRPGARDMMKRHDGPKEQMQTKTTADQPTCQFAEWQKQSSIKWHSTISHPTTCSSLDPLISDTCKPHSTTVNTRRSQF